MTKPSDSDETEVRAVFERYAKRGEAGRQQYDPLRPDVWQTMQERQRVLISLLARQGRPLSHLDVLEIGCGTGVNLLELLRLGFDASRLVGNELLPDRAAEARRRLPSEVRLVEGDASSLPFAPAAFDIVYQSTVFTSLLDEAFRTRLAARMWEWVRPGGAVLWYDFTFDNPSNPDVRGVPLARIRELFPAGQISAHRVTLAPPISRRVCRIHPAAYTLFNAIPWLRTHVLAWIAKA